MKSDVRALTLVAAAASALFYLAYQLPGDIFLDFGPNDFRYVQGFREDFEIDEPTLIHWSQHRSWVRLPFALHGPYDVTLRFKRHIEKPADVRLFLSGSPVASFVVPQSDFQLRTFHSKNPGGGPFELGLVTSSEDPRPLGLALDWLQIRPARRFGATVPIPSAFAALLAWVVSFYVVARWVGLDRRRASLLGLAVAFALAGTAMSHKLWPVHAALTLGGRPLVFLLGLALFYRWRRRSPGSAFVSDLSRWVLLVVGLGMAVRLFALFHPDFYYPDVRTHSKFVSLLWTEGLEGFFRDFIRNQHRHLLGLQYVSGRWVAFPYPPLLYLTLYPLSLLELPVQDWMKLVPTALLAIEALLVFALAGKLGLSSRTAAVAAGLHATARVLAFRLAVASYAALFGHFWDMLAVLYLTLFYERLERPLYGAGLGLLCAVSLLSYAGSALTLGIFVPALCLCLLLWRALRPGSLRLAAIAGWSFAGAVLAIALFYWQYVPELFGGPSPPTAAEAATVGGNGLSGLIDFRFTPGAALSMAGYRLVLFYSLFFGVLAVGLLVRVLFRRIPPAPSLARPLALAAALTYLGMNFLRAGLGSTHIFQFSKDDLVVLPLIALLIGSLIAWLWEKGTIGRGAAMVLVGGWVGFGLVSLAEDVRGRFLRPDYPPAREESVLDQDANTTRLPPARFA